jgi:hypothetical protein
MKLGYALHATEGQPNLALRNCHGQLTERLDVSFHIVLLIRFLMNFFRFLCLLGFHGDKDSTRVFFLGYINKY